MRVNTWLLVASAVIVLGGAFYMNFISADNATHQIQTHLIKAGVTISEISTHEETLKIEAKSTSNSTEAN